MIEPAPIIPAVPDPPPALAALLAPLAAQRALDEVQAIQDVAGRMLKSHDLNEILLHITQEARRLLSADICGVLLREGDEISMRHCVGHHSPETARLRMVPRQGLAGLVLALGAPAWVDHYTASDIISHDFFHLAQAESVRSALAAPLLGRANTIGVLEVWRRHPSTFTGHDTRRLVALANLASIAIENAELHTSQQHTVEQLVKANQALNQRYDTVEGLSTLTRTLMQLLLGGGKLDAIAAEASRYLDTTVLIVDLEGRILARAGEGKINLHNALEQISAISCPDGQTLHAGPHAWHAQSISAGNQTIAWVLGEIGPRPPHLISLALAQVAMVSALHRLEQHAASRARAETIEAIIWDLLQAAPPARLAALDRAAAIGLDLSGPLRLFIAEFGPAASSPHEPFPASLRQSLLEAIGPMHARGVRAAALRGLSLAIICADAALDDIERLAGQLLHRLCECLPGRHILLGGSSACQHAQGLDLAFRESNIALDVARQMPHSAAIMYERAGILGLLLGLRQEADLRRFLALNLGKLLDEPEKHRDPLLHTLRIFFDVNCSHEAAAQRLGVHRKTIANRLVRISELTGLDLSTHDDRLVADISLYVWQLLHQQASGLRLN